MLLGHLSQIGCQYGLPDPGRPMARLDADYVREALRVRRLAAAIRRGEITVPHDLGSDPTSSDETSARFPDLPRTLADR